MQPANKKSRSILPEVADAANILAANLAWIGNSNAYFGQTSSGSSFMHSSSEIECNTSLYLTHSNSYADFNCLDCWTICYVSQSKKLWVGHFRAKHQIQSDLIE
jgi:hypothetical protein